MYHIFQRSPENEAKFIFSSDEKLLLYECFYFRHERCIFSDSNQSFTYTSKFIKKSKIIAFLFLGICIYKCPVTYKYIFFSIREITLKFSFFILHKYFQHLNYIFKSFLFYFLYAYILRTVLFSILKKTFMEILVSIYMFYHRAMALLGCMSLEIFF